MRRLAAGRSLVRLACSVCHLSACPQIKSALLALYSHISSSHANAPSKQLLEEEEDIFLVCAMKKTPLKQHNKPIRISIPHSIFDPATNPGSEICLFTKDPPQPADYDPKSGVPLVNPVKTQLQAHPVAGVTKVLSISKLRNNYHDFKERRRLLSSYTLFLTDERIMPLLPALLGVKFYEKKKQPVAVNIAQHDLTAELTRARDSTYMFVNTGPCSSIRISRSSFSRAQSFDNIQAALDQIAAHIPKHWAGVQSLHIKTQNSIALPIYNSAASIDQLMADPDPEPKKASTKKKGGSKKKGERRVLATRKERETLADPNSKRSLQKKAASDKKTAAAAPTAAASAAAPAAAAKTKGSKRSRDESSETAAAAPAAAAAAAPAQPAKKARSAAAAAEAAPGTPAKSKKTAAASKSAAKAEATPKPKSASTKAAAPATVASKKK